MGIDASANSSVAIWAQGPCDWEILFLQRRAFLLRGAAVAPPAAMDPTATELSTFAVLQDVLTWIGMDDDVWRGLCFAMGQFKFLREVVLVPQSAWDLGVQAAQARGLPAPPSAGGTIPPPPPGRALSALELGQCGSLRRVCRLRLGLPAIEGVAAVVPTTVRLGTSNACSKRKRCTSFGTARSPRGRPCWWSGVVPTTRLWPHQ